MELNDLIKAQTEGRLIILPCKIGETVYGFGEKYGYTCTAPLCISGGQFCHTGSNGCYSRKFVIKPLIFDITMFKDFNEIVFLTENEALDALNKYNNKIREDI